MLVGKVDPLSADKIWNSNPDDNKFFFEEDVQSLLF